MDKDLLQKVARKPSQKHDQPPSKSIPLHPTRGDITLGSVKPGFISDPISFTRTQERSSILSPPSCLPFRLFPSISKITLFGQYRSRCSRMIRKCRYWRTIASWERASSRPKARWTSKLTKTINEAIMCPPSTVRESVRANTMLFCPCYSEL